jgi:hypothetical protein
LLQREDPHETAVDVSKNDGHGGGAEQLRDGGEAAPNGAMFDRRGKVAAIFDQDGENREDGRDMLGHGLAGPILGGIGSGNKAGRERRRVAHGSYYS